MQSQPTNVFGASPGMLDVRWLGRAGAWLTGLLMLAALAVWCRRFAGALNTPPAPVWLAWAGTLAALMAALARLAWKAQAIIPAIAGGRRPTLAPAEAWTPTLATLLLAAGLTVPGTGADSILVLWSPIALEEAIAWGLRLRASRQAGGPPSTAPCLPAPIAEHAAAPAAAPLAGPSALPLLPAAAGVATGQVTQQLTRYLAAGGQDMLVASVAVSLAKGQRGATAHVAFCPPFAATPAGRVELISGAAARVKLAQLLPYGVRLEIKLAAPAEADGELLVRFEAAGPAEAAHQDHAGPPQ